MSHEKVKDQYSNIEMRNIMGVDEYVTTDYFECRYDGYDIYKSKYNSVTLYMLHQVIR